MEEVQGQHCSAGGESSLPRSTSSAMPDPNSENVPRLTAAVHSALTPDRCREISVESLRYRPLSPDDYEEVVALHTEWFPVSYDDGFYRKSVQGDLFSIAASHSDAGREDIVAIATMSTAPEHYRDDLPHVLGVQDDAPAFNNAIDMEQGTADEHGVLAYIMTLGVIDGFRRRGLASEILRQSIRYVEEEKPQVRAVYLHVVTYNTAAIQLYESMNFTRIGHFPGFYNLHGQPYDSYLYAFYVHGARPHWKFRLRQFLGLGSGTLKDWVRSAWSGLWNQRGQAGSASDRQCLTSVTEPHV